ncbi:hypothetical protein FG385_31590 [Amycolatopsis alkalitolerans]|uniref:Uncharacterized protein n=1 Tax=Amycolatopsis alkalitolerans TaxID=2547244 RepID=A0A5C4LR09_9PSEU|nr:hypothetical protein FG385_31590 [Amycolatopsis alkalitolerans]
MNTEPTLAGRWPALWMSAAPQLGRSVGLVELTCQHKNREVLVEGPEITIRPVGTRRRAAVPDDRRG